METNKIEKRIKINGIIFYSDLFGPPIQKNIRSWDLEKFQRARGREARRNWMLAGLYWWTGEMLALEILWTDPKMFFWIFWGTKQIKDDAIYHFILFWWMSLFRSFFDFFYTRAGGGIDDGSIFRSELSFYPFDKFIFHDFH